MSNQMSPYCLITKTKSLVVIPVPSLSACNFLMREDDRDRLQNHLAQDKSGKKD